MHDKGILFTVEDFNKLKNEGSQTGVWYINLFGCLNYLIEEMWDESITMQVFSVSRIFIRI